MVEQQFNLKFKLDQASTAWKRASASLSDFNSGRKPETGPELNLNNLNLPVLET